MCSSSPPQSELSGTPTSSEGCEGVRVPLCLSTALPMSVPSTTHKQACVICAESLLERWLRHRAPVLPRRHWATSRGVFGRHCWRWGAAGA